MTRPLLLATDLDRTLIPNGEAPESPGARERLRRFIAGAGAQLVFVTGRHQALVEEAILDYALPTPAFVIGDVGTSLYRVTLDGWLPMADWLAELAQAWDGSVQDRITELLADVPALRPQEADKQGTFKLSYYAAAQTDAAGLLADLESRLATQGLAANLIWSLDEVADVGLLDVLPARATKYHALAYLMSRLGYDETTTLFAGDSGNDLEVLVSEIPAILVANAQREVRQEARRRALANGQDVQLYCARGGWGGMNGNYCAGVLEGVAHYRPDLAPWLEAPGEGVASD